MKKEFRLIIIVNLVITLSLLLSGYFVFIKKDKTKIAYVDIVLLFEKFDLKKELENEYDAIIMLREKEKDSLNSLILILQQEIIEQGELTKKEEKEFWHRMIIEANNKIAEINKVNEVLTEEYESKIWKHLNAYTQDYASQKKYDIVFGTIGNGSIMAAENKLDITEELILFANKRYQDD